MIVSGIVCYAIEKRTRSAQGVKKRKVSGEQVIVNRKLDAER